MLRTQRSLCTAGVLRADLLEEVASELRLDRVLRPGGTDEGE